MPDKYTYATPDPFKLLQDKISDLERRVRQVEPRIYPEDWHYVGDSGEPAFQNGWVNAGAPYDNLAFMHGRDGFIHVKGVITGVAVTAVVFTLPTDYRPATNLNVAIVRQTSPDIVFVSTTGDITIQATLASHLWHLNFQFRSV